MEPLSALGLAGNVVQFVQFALELFYKSKEVYNSSSGISADSEHLERICTKLQDFNDKLTRQAIPSAPGISTARPTYASSNLVEMEEIVQVCRTDCEKLLEITNGLRARRNGKRTVWRSFSEALREVAKSSDIQRLKGRIRENQAMIVLSILAVSRECVEASVVEMMKYHASAKSEQDARSLQADSLLSSLRQIGGEVSHIKAYVVKPDGYTLRRAPKPEEVETLTNRVWALSLSERKFAREESILASLDFKQRPHRHEAIPVAYKNTFQWILKPPLDGRLGDQPNFRSWLECGDGLFWISGKPGSGKSTLVKFIQGSKDTKTALSRWAGSKRVVTIGFYFWSAGAAIQKSREGLLRSLLYSILRQVPELIPEVCSDHWAAEDASPSQIGIKRDGRWTIANLDSALKRLRTLGELPAKICILVDGVDEYEGDSLALSTALVNLSSINDIKLCVSSRPWNVFRDSFGADPARRLSIHELTRKDMESYVTGRLVKHARWSVVADGLGQGRSIITEIVERSEGVFLWVYLVTKMLREGITNHDSLGDLWKRLGSLPTDLDDFFRHIISTVEPFYYQKLTGSLLITLAARSPLPVEIYSFHELEYDDENYAIHMPTKAMEEQEAGEFHRSTPRRLNGWSKGLLEVRFGNVEFLHRTVRDFLRTGQMTAFLHDKRAAAAFDAPLSILRAYVSWIKRTKFGEDIWRTLTRDTNGTLRFAEEDTGRTSARHPTLGNLLDRSLWYASAIKCEKVQVQQSLELLLDHLELSLVKMAQSVQLGSSLLDDATTASKVTQLYRERIIINDVGSYLSSKLDQKPHYLERSMSPLDFTLTSFLVDKGDWIAAGCKPKDEPRCENVLRSLLQHGYSPNAPVKSDPSRQMEKKPWVSFVSIVLPHLDMGALRASLFDDTLDYTTSLEMENKPWAAFDPIVLPQLRVSELNDTPSREEQIFLHTVKAGIFSILMRHGADPNSEVMSYMSYAEESPPFWLSWIFTGFAVLDLWRYSEQYLEATQIMFNSKVDISLEVLQQPYSLDLDLLCRTIKAFVRNVDNPKRLKFIVDVIVELARAMRRAGFPWENILCDVADWVDLSVFDELRSPLGTCVHEL